jgi:hypothetical protein
VDVSTASLTLKTFAKGPFAPHCRLYLRATTRNKAQFQKGLSETEFNQAYGSEEQCHAALVKWRWPNGLECPDCGGKARCVGTRKLFQFNACRKQTSVRAGTIFAASKLPLRLWFAAIYHLT